MMCIQEAKLAAGRMLQPEAAENAASGGRQTTGGVLQPKVCHFFHNWGRYQGWRPCACKCVGDVRQRGIVDKRVALNNFWQYHGMHALDFEKCKKEFEL
ncbi:MAG: hypothetical protein IKY83_02065 [Proteobacteria bacterium]|nr:hypothetical protein [Pseudomonadota bacterium]